MVVQYECCLMPQLELVLARVVVVLQVLVLGQVLVDKTVVVVVVAGAAAAVSEVVAAEVEGDECCEY